MAKLNKQKKLLIGFSGAVGAFLAALADVTRKGQASAIGKIEKALETEWLGGINIPQISVVFLLMGLAIFLCLWIYKPQTNFKALFVGASILSIIMTLTPYRLAPSLLTYPPNETVLKFSTEGSLAYNFFRSAPCFAQLPGETPTLPGETLPLPGETLPLPGETLPLPGETPTLPAETRQFVLVNIQLITDDKTPISEAIVILQDSVSRTIIARSKFTSSDLYFYQPAGDYIITLEAPGYRIAELKTSLQTGQQEKPLVILLNPTWIPLSLQRLLR